MTIRAPYVRPPFDVPAIISTPLGSPGVLLAAIVAAAPFFNTIALGSATTFPDAASSVAPQPQRNPNLYPNPIPFAQYQWPRVTPLGPSVSRQAVFNSELFLNPIPFAQYDWSKPKQPPAKAADVYQPYGNFYPFAVINAPFYQSAWPSVSSVKPVPPQASTYNSQIYTNPIPFNTRMSGSVSLFDMTPTLPGTPAYNLNLYGTTALSPPFIPILWGGAASVDFVLSPLHQVNYAGMYSQPVIPLQYGGGTFISGKAADVYQPYQNFYPFVVVTAPFYQTSWPSVSPVKPVPPQPIPYNDQLYTNPLPFAQYDWSKPFQIAPRAADVYQPYQNFYPLTVIFAPFYQSSWPSVNPVKPVPPQATPYNSELYTNPIPFAQYDWSKPVSIAPKASDVYQPYGNFYPVVILVPFAQYDWPTVKPVKTATLAPLASVNYAGMYSSPFGQSYWPQVTKPAPSVSLPFNFNSPLYFVQPPFSQNYWPRVQTVRSSPPQPQPFNDLLYKNPIPFAQYYWPRVQSIKEAPPQFLNGGAVSLSSYKFLPSWRVAYAVAIGKVAVVPAINKVAVVPAIADYDIPPRGT